MLLRPILIFLLLLQFAAAGAQPAPGPMQCSLEGRIVRILPPAPADSGTVCGNHPCRALVKVLHLYSCGSSVSVSPPPGGIMEVKFMCTLLPTKQIFPGMKRQYPGLRKGSRFKALAAQRISPVAPPVFVVYDYEMVRSGK